MLHAKSSPLGALDFLFASAYPTPTTAAKPLRSPNPIPVPFPTPASSGHSSLLLTFDLLLLRHRSSRPRPPPTFPWRSSRVYDSANDSASDRLVYRPTERKRQRPRGAMQASSPSWKDGAFSKSKVQLPWRSIKLLVPHRIRRKLRSKIRNRQSPASSITALQTSFNPIETLRALQSHKWTIFDGQYLFFAFLGIFSLCVIQNPGPLIKTGLATLLLTSLVLPITRQFFLPALPIFAWLIFFFACQ